MSTNHSFTSDLIGQRKQRIDHLAKLRDAGINPYPSESEKTHSNQEILSNFLGFEKKTVTLAGRITAFRNHGKIIFGDCQDQSGTIQIGVKKDDYFADRKKSYLDWELLSYVDVGDFIQIEGTVGKTQQGEITVFAHKIKLLAKSLRPMPHQFEDKEEQFRKRYIDLTINRDRKQLFERKSIFWDTCRTFMKQHDFKEVETPVLEHVTGGADAQPFITHHSALDQDFYLRISTELYQKRLIGGGFEKIFTIGPNFRNEGSSDEHLQEFYQLEWYWAYADYRDNMKLVVELLRYLAKSVYGKTKFSTRGHTFDLAHEWEEIDYSEAIHKHFAIDILKDSDEKMLQALKKEGIELTGAVNRNRIIDNLWKVIRKGISGPAFLINEPAFMSPLAKAKSDNPAVTERFHVLLAGSELGNGYSEINDPMYQLDQFLDQQKLREGGDAEAQMLDIDFIEMLEYGMPPTSGYGQSERVFWYFEDITGREGTLFPQLRTHIDELTKEIYPQIPFDKKVKKQPILTTPSATDLAGLPSRKKAHELLDTYVKEPYQILHSEMVASALEAYAKEYQENEDLWYITGLLHDLDYGQHPDEHPIKSLAWFREWKFPEVLINAVEAHGHVTGRVQKKPETRLDYALIACDELSGLMYAASLIRPQRFEGMEAKSILKRFKEPKFAAKIDRKEILLGVEGLGVDLKEHIQKLIAVFQSMEKLKK